MDGSGYYAESGLEGPRGQDILGKLLLAHRKEIEWACRESVTPPLTCCVILSKLPNLSVSLENVDCKSSHFTELS